MRVVSAVACGLAIAACVAGCGEPKKHPIGKDTVKSFGDGTWSILKTGSSHDGSRKLHLYCHETLDTLVHNVADWRQAGDWVYAMGEDGAYAVVNFRTSWHGTYKSPDEAPEEHRSELRALRRR